LEVFIMGENEGMGIVGGLVAGAVIGAAAVLGYMCIGSKPRIPSNVSVNAGYVDPGKLEVMVQDLDNNGTNRTLVKYDGKTYLLMVENGRPVARQYQIIVEDDRKAPVSR
jgi:hypothetical protein